MQRSLVYSASSGANPWIWFPGSWEWNSSGWRTRPYGRVFQNLEEVRTAVRRFVDTYNREWLVEKNGFLSPWQVKAKWLYQDSIPRAA